MPHLRNLTVLGVDRANDMLTIETRSAAASAACPGCGVMSRRGHGGYRRSIDDTPLAGVRVVIGVTVRRFTCRELFPRL